MGFHTFPIERARKLDDVGRYRYLLRDEPIALLEPTEGDRIVDLGSGTGFVTDEVASFVDRVHAVDVQKAMHDLCRKKGRPENVTLMTAEIQNLPLVDGSVDAAVTTMTYHEFFNPSALGEVRRVLRPAGRFVIVDWSPDGGGGTAPTGGTVLPLDDERSVSSGGILDRARSGTAGDVRNRRRPVASVAVRCRSIHHLYDSGSRPSEYGNRRRSRRRGHR